MNAKNIYSLSSYTYELPKELIAETAIHPQHDARLMIVDRQSGKIVWESTYRALDELLDPDAVLYFNDTKVLPARIVLKDIPYIRSDGTSSQLKTGEILYLQNTGKMRFEALIHPGAKFRIWTKFMFGGDTVEVVDITPTGRILELSSGTIEWFLEKHGALPLPPYIHYDVSKEADYQTVFAKKNGSVAAPTASLHFTDELLSAIRQPKEFVTLHVGMGTFRWVDVTDVRDYQIHDEQFEVPREIFSKLADQIQNHQKITAVGTTACRTLESLPYLWRTLSNREKSQYPQEVQEIWEELSHDAQESFLSDIYTSETSYFARTRIYLYPGRPFRIIRWLITNFHLPGSSLIVLVSAFLGYTETMDIYERAIEHRYRFFSFGDGMYIR